MRKHRHGPQLGRTPCYLDPCHLSYGQKGEVPASVDSRGILEGRVHLSSDGKAGPGTCSFPVYSGIKDYIKQKEEILSGSEKAGKSSYHSLTIDHVPGSHMLSAAHTLAHPFTTTWRATQLYSYYPQVAKVNKGPAW